MARRSWWDLDAGHQAQAGGGYCRVRWRGESVFPRGSSRTGTTATSALAGGSTWRLECGNGDPVTATTAQPSLTHTGEDKDFQPTYAICADVAYRPSTAGWRGVHSPTWWPWRKLTQEVVLDCGPFRAFAESYAASMIADDVTRFAAPQATL